MGKLILYWVIPIVYVYCRYELNIFSHLSSFFHPYNSLTSYILFQDLECLTPNLLCRVVETVSGGGAVVLATELNNIQEYKDIDMDVHYKLTTQSHPIPSKLFNKR